MIIASLYKIKIIPQGIAILINNVPVPRVNCYKCMPRCHFRRKIKLGTPY